MTRKATLIDKASRAVAFIPDENSVLTLIREYGSGVADEYFLFATGKMAELGHEVLRGALLFDPVAEKVSMNPHGAGIWGFSTPVALRAAFIAVKSAGHLPGSAFMAHLPRVKVSQEASAV